MAKTLDDYLDHIGLREYAPAFRHHGVTSLELLKGLDGPAGADTRGRIRTEIRDGLPRAPADAGEAAAAQPDAAGPDAAKPGDARPAVAKPPAARPATALAPSPLAAMRVDTISAQDIQAWVDAEARAASQPWKGDPEAEARRNKLQAAITEVNDLRAACEGATEAERAKAAAATAGRLEKLLGEFKAAGLGSLPSAEALAKNVEGELAALEKSLSGLSQLTEAAVQQKAMTAVELIDAHQLLRGQIVDARGLTEAPGGAVLAMPRRCADSDLFGPGLEAQDFGFSYRSEAAMQQAERLLETHGQSLAVSAEASGAFFAGTGIGAVSVSARYAHARDERHERFDLHGSTAVTEIQTRYHWSPMRQVVFSTLQFALGTEALAELRAVAALADGAPKRAAALAFMRAFGSHVFGRITLGGWYKYTAKAVARSGTDRKELTDAVATAMDWAASAAATYAGLGGAMRTKSAVTGSAADTRVSGLQMYKTESNHEVSIATSTFGGVDGLPREAWIGSIQYAPQWRVIQRSAPCPIWTVIARTRSSDLGMAQAVDMGALARLFEATWVQALFAPAFPTALDLPALLADKGIDTVPALETFLEKTLPQLEAGTGQPSGPPMDWTAPVTLGFGGTIVDDPDVAVFRHQLFCVVSVEPNASVRRPVGMVHDGLEWHETPGFAAVSAIAVPVDLAALNTLSVQSCALGALPGTNRLATMLLTQTGTMQLARLQSHLALQVADPWSEPKGRPSFEIAAEPEKALRSDCAPHGAIVGFGGRTLLLCVDQASRITVMPLGRDGAPDLAQRRIVQAETTGAAPPAWVATTASRIAAAVFRQTLHCAYRGVDGPGLWHTTSLDGVHWTAPVPLNVKGSPFGPSLAAFHGPDGPRLYCAYAGLGPEAPLYLMSSADGVAWSRPVKVRDRLAEQLALQQSASDEVDEGDAAAAGAPAAAPRRHVRLGGSPALVAYADFDGARLHCFYRVDGTVRCVAHPEQAFNLLAPTT